jgi:hypothetical protein
MRKIILLLLCCSIVRVGFAQESFKNKRGITVTPEKGEISLGFDAVPVLKFAGSLFNDQNDAPYAGFTADNPLTISGKYVHKDNMAIRLKVRLGFGTEKSDTLVARIGSTNTAEKVSNETKVNRSSIAIGAGVQKWRGKGRIRGFYGGEGMLKVSTEKTNYAYGNALSNENQTPRISSEKPGNVVGFNLRGFIGVEYFFAAKASLSAEFGWGPEFEVSLRGAQETETWNGVQAETNIVETGKSSSFYFDNDNAEGAIQLNFYF